MAEKNLQIIVDPKSGTMEMWVDKEKLTVDSFLTDTQGLQVRTLNPEEQKQLLKFILKNILT